MNAIEFIKKKHYVPGSLLSQEVVVELMEAYVKHKTKKCSLPANELIESLGEIHENNEYILIIDNGRWWIEHKHVGSAEPLKQWLTGKPE